MNDLNVLSIATPISLAVSRSLMESPFCDKDKGRVGAAPIEIWPHVFSFEGLCYSC